MATSKPQPLMARKSPTKPKPKNYVPMSQTAPYSGTKPKPPRTSGGKSKPQGYRANTNPTATATRRRINTVPSAEGKRPGVAPLAFGRQMKRNPPKQTLQGKLRGYYGY